MSVQPRHEGTGQLALSVLRRTNRPNLIAVSLLAGTQV